MHEFERDPRSPASQRDPRQSTGPQSERTVAARPTGLDTASILHLQRTAGNTGVVQLLEDQESARSSVHDIVGKGGGSPLDGATRGSMEQAFGDSFGDVRVHTGDAASRSAESVGANAYTVGSDIVFRSGHGPGSPTFQRDVAHELEHVRQQRAGPVDGTDAAGGIRLSSPSDRFERAAAQQADAIVAGLGGAGSPAASVQRTDDSELPIVQRQEGEDEDEREEETGSA